jgi:hypothetical protein
MFNIVVYQLNGRKVQCTTWKRTHYSVIVQRLSIGIIDSTLTLVWFLSFYVTEGCEVIFCIIHILSVYFRKPENSVFSDAQLRRAAKV